MLTFDLVYYPGGKYIPAVITCDKVHQPRMLLFLGLCEPENSGTHGQPDINEFLHQGDILFKEIKQSNFYSEVQMNS